MKISVSFLSSKYKGDDVAKLDVTDVDYIHCDVMDGRFTPKKSISFRQMKKIDRFTGKRLDIHLMVKNVEKYIKKYAILNAEYITFHVETDPKKIEKCIDLIHKYGIKAGLAISPETDLDELLPYLKKIELVLLMSVTPGKGGQEFISTTQDRLKELKELIELNESKAIVSVDGGINQDTKKFVSEADILVSGSYVIKSNNFQEAITSLR